MPPVPLALLPCRLLLWTAGLLIARPEREAWHQEWLAEAWAHYTQSRPLGGIYRACAGCIADAWWQFAENAAGKQRMLEWMRSPMFCLVALAALLGVCAASSGFLQATRTILGPLPYAEQDRLAVISRTGRLEPVRRGIPGFLVSEWKSHSKLMDGLAMCRFPRKASIRAHGRQTDAVRLIATANLFSVLGANLPGGQAQTGTVWISDAFWQREYKGDLAVVGTSANIDGEPTVIAGVLPRGFWFLSPSIDAVELHDATFAAEGIAVVRAKTGVSAQALEADLVKVAADEGYEFARTAPHAVFLREAMQTPLWLFGSALLIAGVLVALAHGSRWMRVEEAGAIAPRHNWRWWMFFAVKTAAALAIVLAVGIEVFVGRRQQAIGDALGGAALIWFYVTGCSVVLFTSISDQRSRCRVCQRLLASPIRIGCPGCLLLEWAGTEFLCPQGHGVLYVPHHVACWEEADRWVLLEV